MRARFLFGAVALTALSLAIHWAGLEDLSLEAAPAPGVSTTFGRFFRVTVALTAPLLTIRLGRLDDDRAVWSFDAAPAGSTTRTRFLFGFVALASPLPALGRGGLENLSIDAAPTR
jgi:hypothetical protein